MSDAIKEFSGEFGFLSNFFPAKVMFENIMYPTSEHAYQAAKTLDVEERKRIAAIIIPGQAKREGNSLLSIRKDWEQIKVSIMESILRIKFLSNTCLLNKLIATGDKELIEGNWWGDCFWGVCKGVGENNLGKLLMKIRTDLQKMRGRKSEEDVIDVLSEESEQRGNLLDEVREAFEHGANEELWPPGVSLGIAVQKLVSNFYTLKETLEDIALNAESNLVHNHSVEKYQAILKVISYYARTALDKLEDDNGQKRT
jgi:ribA/ribD-fused uncharacterized protein